MFVPQKAAVRPRAFAPHCGEPLPLQDLVMAFLEERQREGSEAGTIIRIEGGAGAGKSTALAHLAAVLPGVAGMAFLDGESPEIAICRKLRRETVILVSSDEDLAEVDVSFELAPWTADDLLEYLLATHPRECGVLLTRIRQAGDDKPLQGNPELWRTALEELAAEPTLPGVRAALEQAVRRIFERSDDRWYAETDASGKTNIEKLIERWNRFTVD